MTTTTIMMMTMIIIIIIIIIIALKGAILLTAPRTVSNTYALVAQALSCATT